MVSALSRVEGVIMTERRHLLQALVLTAAPVTLVASELLYTTTPDDPRRGITVIGSHQTSWFLANVLGLLAAALFIGTLHILAAVPTHRGRRFAQVGQVLGALGVVGYAAHTGLFVMLGQMGKQGHDRAAMARLVVAMDGNPAVGIVLLLFLGGLYVGLVLLMIGATRAGSVRVWSTTCVSAAVVLAMVPVPGVDIAAEALVILGLASAGLSLGTEPSATPTEPAPTRTGDAVSIASE
jgi:hypothetical protein